MKAKPYFIINHEVKDFMIKELIDLPVGQDYKVTISKSGTKSQRQRGLQWRWYTDVSRSGIGDCDDKNEIHLRSKFRWALPIFLRDDDFFADLYCMYKARYKNEPDRMSYFIDTKVSTEDFTVSQAAEYLTEFQRYWLQAGVNLTNPDLYGLDLR